MQNLRVRPLPESPVPTGFLDRCETVSGALVELCERFPDLECLTVLGRDRREERTTLGALAGRAAAVAEAARARGLGPGDHALLILPTGSDLVAAYFGVMVLGGVPALAAVPSNRISDPRLYRQLVSSILRSGGARLVICEDDVADLLDVPDLLGDARLLRTSGVAPTAALLPAHEAARDDVATIQYSSGTTGDPKGVVLSHRAMLNYMRALRDGVRLTAGDVNVNWAPLYHDMGLFGAFLLPLLCGCPTVLIPTMDFLREPPLWLWAIHHYRGAVSWAPNFAYSLCAQRIDDDEIEGLDLSSWRVAFNASEPVLAHSVAAFAERFAPYGYRPEAMTAAWGLAETVMVGTVHPVDEEPLVDRVDRRRLARDGHAVALETGAPEDEGVAFVATGVPLPEFEIEIRDVESGEPLPDRQVGMIWLRSHCLFEGYQNDPERTAEALVDGWLDSGDRGYKVDGHLFFVSREKDLIVIGGEKYAPHDVETSINRVADVRQGCVVAFGVRNDALGTEELGAVVETRVERSGERKKLDAEIRREVMRTIGVGIRHLHLVPPGGVTKTTSGKLARRATRARYPEVFGHGS